MAPMASRPTRDYMHIASSLGKLKDRLRFSGTLRVRLTAASTLLIVATTFVIVALLARYSAGVQLEAQYRAGDSLLRALALAPESRTVRAPPVIDRPPRAAAGHPAVAGLLLRAARGRRPHAAGHRGAHGRTPGARADAGQRAAQRRHPQYAGGGRGRHLRPAAAGAAVRLPAAAPLHRAAQAAHRMGARVLPRQ